MSEVLLTVGEVADLKNCSHRHVQMLAKTGKLKYQILEVHGRGQATNEYRIPLTSLDQDLQNKYKRKQRDLVKKEIATVAQPNTSPSKVDYETLTEKEREEIAFWRKIIKEWHTFRNVSPLMKREADAQYIDFTNAKFKADFIDFELNLKTLYRKDKLLRTEGERGLINKTGKHNNRTTLMTQEMQEIFEFYYLDEQHKKPVTLCMTLTELELKRRYGTAPPMPSVRSFNRAVEKIPLPVRMLFREGEKVFIGQCAPYITRMYEDIKPNDIWVADGHTFDVSVRAKDGKVIRPYLSAFMDVRTRKMMGWIVTDKLNGDTTIYALKRGVEKFGTPKAIQVDNGREYLFEGFSGDAGFRKKAKKKDGEFVTPTILENLGIEIRVSLPTNARGKGIERTFKTVIDTFSKIFPSYTGKDTVSRPDNHSEIVKDENLMDIDKFTEIVDQYIENWYNDQKPHNGEGMSGDTPNEKYYELLTEKRVVPKDKLHLMFLRYGKGTVKVGKGGAITIRIWGEQL